MATTPKPRQDALLERAVDALSARLDALYDKLVGRK